MKIPGASPYARATKFQSQIDIQVRSGTPLPETIWWRALRTEADVMKGASVTRYFQEDAKRAERFSVKLGDTLLFDYSKQLIRPDTMNHLFALAHASGVEEARAAMFAGKHINWTEDRAVLHTALRSPAGTPFMAGEQDLGKLVHEVLDQMEPFVQKVRDGSWTGSTGKQITDVVNIGIGGSDLGPAMVSDALQPYADGPKVHYVSNIDATHMVETLSHLNPETTLFIVASKSFTTQETLKNAQSAREWLLNRLPKDSFTKDNEAVAKHFVAVSTNTERVSEFGINTENMFGFWDWVGGRYSVWSAIGLPIALSIGFNGFKEFLGGAHEADEHFLNAPLDQNIPAIMAALSIWNSNFLGFDTQLIMPYDQYMHRLTAYLQQQGMESNGKGIDRDGNPVSYNTGPIIWGEPGTGGQHSYMQLVHQGTRKVPTDYIGFLNSHNPLGDHHAILMANMFGQAEALMQGRNAETVKAELAASGMDEAAVAEATPHRVFSGNRPTTTMLFDKLTPHTLGMIIALYEHKTFVEGTIWRLNSFDQWGVQLGKVLAKAIEGEIAALRAGEKVDLSHHDASTRRMIEMFAKKKI